jgi:hypothetical protein
MKKRDLACIAFFVVSVIMTGCGGSTSKDAPKITKMKSEFVPDGGVAIIYGKNFEGATVLFSGDQKELEAVVDKTQSNDTMLVVTVPEGALSGQITIKSAEGIEAKSDFFFRDNRNIIVNFDDRLATWGGYLPFDKDGNKITSIGDVALSAKLPDPCSGNYGFLYGKYDTPWEMNSSMWIQYVANPDEGGRGKLSVAGAFESYKIEDLALKFEVYIPKEIPYKGVKTDIFFGPYDSPDKHGRDVSAICFWEPYAQTGSFYTGEWETITVPLTEFNHGVKTDEEQKEIVDLKTATNFSFVQFGAPKEVMQIFMCVDNFRIVPVGK